MPALRGRYDVCVLSELCARPLPPNTNIDEAALARSETYRKLMRNALQAERAIILERRALASLLKEAEKGATSGTMPPLADVLADLAAVSDWSTVDKEIGVSDSVAGALAGLEPATVATGVADREQAGVLTIVHRAEQPADTPNLYFWRG